MVSPGEQSVSQNAADLGSPSRRGTVGQISRSWLAPWHLRGTRVGDFSGSYGRRKLLRLFNIHRPSFRVCVLGEYGPLLGPVTPALDDPVERGTVTRDNDIRRAQLCGTNPLVCPPVHPWWLGWELPDKVC